MTPLSSWHRRPIGAALLALALALALLVVSDSTTRPAPAAAAGGSAKVFAHYMPPFPVSIDNRSASSDYYATHYLRPQGEGGRHARYGGLLRDRPSPRSPIAGSDWKLRDLESEVRAAKSGGIDGFTLNLMSADGLNWERSVNLMRAAANVGGFEVVPNVDASSSFARLSPTVAADRLAVLLKMPAAGRSDGVRLLSSFAAERMPVSWWKGIIDGLRARHGISVRFVAVFLDATDANMRAFAPISHGFGNWGVRTASTVNAARDNVARAHAMGKIWMAPVAFQDSRPQPGVYAESGNTDLARAMWFKAINNDADLVQVVTWNDYSESTQVAPSVAHGNAFLRLNARYASWFRTGRAPAITEDSVYLTHRIQRHAATSRLPVTPMRAVLGGASTPPRDTVEALLFLTAPATVSLTSGGVTKTVVAPQGPSNVLVPLATGRPSVTVKRGGTTVLTLTSPHTVVSQPEVTDLQYWASSAHD